MRKDPMPLFIQAMYGTILGVAFYVTAIPTAAHLTFELRNILSLADIFSYMDSKESFKFCLFLFTLIYCCP